MPVDTAEDRHARAVALVSETMGELVEFWGFKASLGRIWAALYLSPEPLAADQIATATGLSAGAVSMGLQELDQWGLLRRVPISGTRKRHYTAHTEVWEVIRRVFRERELRLVGRAVDRFSEALAILEADAGDDPSEELAFIIDRVRGLLVLARTGYQLVERFTVVGDFTLEPLKGTLSGFIPGSGKAR